MSTVRTPTLWDIGLSAWIIQDGNYPNFAAGQIAEFAVEFSQEPGTAVEPCDSDISAQSLGDAAYNVVAEKVLLIDKITVLNVGVLVYSQFLGAAFRTSPKRFLTRLHLGVDPFCYFECANVDGVLPLVYTWRVACILRQTAPFVRVDPNTRMRDRSKSAFDEIPRTDAWKDDNGHGDYVLRCELLPIAPKNTSATACHP